MDRMIDRFDAFMRAKDLNDNRVTVQAKLSVGTIGKSRNEGRDLSMKVVEALLATYPDLNKEWLLTGCGEMLNAPQDIFERLERVFTYQHISDFEFEKIEGIPSGTFKRAKSHNDLSTAKAWVEKLRTRYPQYSRDWLLYGFGGIFKDPLSAEKASINTDMVANLIRSVNQLELQLHSLKAMLEGEF